MAPGRVGPDCAGDYRETQHREAPSQQLIIDSIELFEARPALFEWRERPLALEPPFVSQIDHANARGEHEQRVAEDRERHVNRQPYAAKRLRQHDPRLLELLESQYRCGREGHGYRWR